MSEWLPQPTRDGSFTFFSEAFNEAFHSKQGARTEAIEKFAIATHLPQLAQNRLNPTFPDSSSPIRILDICYGLGINTAAALETLWHTNPHCPIELYGLELDPTVPLAASTPDLIQIWSPTVQTALKTLAQQYQINSPLYQENSPVPTQSNSQGPNSQFSILNSQLLPSLTAHLLIGDARQTITQLLAKGFQADAIFFDPFSPRRCPQLWTVEFFEQVAQCMAPEGRLATYSRSASVRAAMLQAGLRIGTMPLAHPDPKHPHEWAQGTIAVLPTASAELTPLSTMEQEHLKTRAGVPLRDPTLMDEANGILERQRQEQMESDRESTSSWRRRWGLG